MFNTAFLERQRARILRRRQLHLAAQQSEVYLPASKDHKIYVVRNVIPLVLSRMDRGLYGICVDCGEEIPRQRLELIPAALRCVSCQSPREES